MENLWSPWRSEYIQSASERDNTTDEIDCFLCKAVGTSELSADNLIVANEKHSVVVLNRYPYNSGHLLVAPFKHVGYFELLTESDYHDLMGMVKKSCSIVREILKPHALNVGSNIGIDAGAGVPDHLHFHIVPRWRGDTNFMPILADVKIISDAMADTWQKFHEAFLKFQQ